MLRTLFGKKQTERLPNEAYVLAQGERDGLPVIAMINDAYKRYPFREDYPWHVEIEIEMADLDEARLPTEAESVVLNCIEDDMEAAMRKSGAVHHIARQTWNGLRVLDYYVENGPAIESLLAAVRDARPPRSFKFTVERDDSWSHSAGFF